MIKRLLAIFGLSIISLILLAVPFWAKSHPIVIASEPEHIPPPPQNKGVLFKHPANSNKILEDRPN